MNYCDIAIITIRFYTKLIILKNIKMEKYALTESEIYLELIKQKFTERQKIETDLTKVMIMYLATIGLLIKFSLDSNSTHELRITLSVFAIIITSTGFVQCHFVNKMRKSIENELTNLNEKIGNPLTNTEQLTLKYYLPIISAFLLIVIVGFVYLIAKALN